MDKIITFCGWAFVVCLVLIVIAFLCEVVSDVIRGIRTYREWIKEGRPQVNTSICARCKEQHREFKWDVE